MKLRKTTVSNMITLGMVVAAFGIVQTLLSTGSLSYAMKNQLVPICAYIMMALSLNLTVGVLGELSLGHAGFMSVGAFTGTTVAMLLADSVSSGLLRFVIAALCGAALAAVMGFLIGIPVLRLRGDYLAIVTLAFGEIIKGLINCLYIGRDIDGIHVSFGSEPLKLGEGGKKILQGAAGVIGNKKLSTFTIGFVMIVITLFIIFTFVDSRAGRAVMAIRDNRIAAESVGIPITKYKMMAFILSAAIAGAAGVLYGMSFSSITPLKFNYDQSINILLFVVLGGIGSMRGSIISAALLTILPEMLRSVAEYRMLVYAIVLIAVMLITNNKTARQFISFVTGKLAGLFTSRSAKAAEAIVAADATTYAKKEDGADE